MNKKKRNIIIVVVIIALIACAGIIYKVVSRNNSPKLTEQEVQKIALEDASIKNNEVATISVKYDADDNEYEVDFITNDGTKQYEYTIDGNSGQIEERDYESITINNKSNTGEIKTSNSPINLDKAKEIAVTDAGFTISQVKFVSEKYEKEDKEFDIEFIGTDKSDSKEYKYEYNIKDNGKIISKDKDRDLN